MFLRSQLVSRLPVTALRLYCNFVPSTSSLASILSPSRNVLSRRHIHTTATITPQGASHFGASLAWIRGNRKNFEEAEEVKGARTKHTDDSNSSSSNKGGPERWKLTESERREANSLKQRFTGVIVLGGCMIVFLITADGPVPDGLIPIDAPHVDFATFAEKYLRAGEIQKITYIMGHQKAMATLHAGAVIDGQPAKSNAVVINYPNSLPFQFEEHVRKEEAAMGISLAQGVDIEMLSLIPPWKWLVSRGGTLVLGVLTMWNVAKVLKFRRGIMKRTGY